MSEITDQLKELKERAGLSISDTAIFCQYNHGTVRSWLRGVVPQEHRVMDLKKNLKLLAIVIDQGLFPIPPSFTQYQRKSYVEEVRDAVLGKISKSNFIHPGSDLWRFYKPKKSKRG